MFDSFGLEEANPWVSSQGTLHDQARRYRRWQQHQVNVAGAGPERLAALQSAAVHAHGPAALGERVRYGSFYIGPDPLDNRDNIPGKRRRSFDHMNVLIDRFKASQMQQTEDMEEARRMTLRHEILTKLLDPARRRSQRRRRRARYVAVIALPLAFSSGIIWLAAVPQTILPVEVFEYVSSAVWLALKVGLTWYPVRSVASFGVPARWTWRLDCVALLTPLVCLVIEVTIRLATGNLYMALLASQVFAFLTIQLVLPFSLYAVRLYQARIVSSTNRVLVAKRRAVTAILGLEEGSVNWKKTGGDSALPKKKKKVEHEEDEEDEEAELRRIDALVRRTQLIWRALVERRKAKRELVLRLSQLTQLSKPILLAALFFLVGTYVRQVGGMLGREWAGALRGVQLDAVDSIPSILWSLAPVGLLAPGALVVLFDAKLRTVRFSLTHVIFFVSCIQSLAPRIGDIIEVFIAWCNSQDFLAGSVWESIVPATGAIGVQIAATTLGMITLQLASLRNTFSQFLFAFQFFDMAFFEAVFLPATNSFNPNLTWALSCAWKTIFVTLRNSGTNTAITRKLFTMCGLQPKRAEDDPLVRVQYTARLAVQLNIADIAAAVTVPIIISQLTLRDGFYLARGSGAVTTVEDLPYIWLRSLVQLPFKVIGFIIASRWLKHRMRQVVLGKTTLLGESKLRARITVAEKATLQRQQTMRTKMSAISQILEREHARIGPTGDSAPSGRRGGSSLRATVVPLPRDASLLTFGLQVPPARPSLPARAARRESVAEAAAAAAAKSALPAGRKLVRMRSSNLRRALNISKEQQRHLQDEVTISGLNYYVITGKLLRRNWLYFVFVIWFQLFAIFSPTRSLTRTMHSYSREKVVEDMKTERFAWGVPSPELMQTLMAELVRAANRSEADERSTVTVQGSLGAGRRLAWMQPPPAVSRSKIG